MMQIALDTAGKKFNRDWIFRNFSYHFQQGKSYAITGPNGSGKSTILQVLGGSMGVSTGKIEWKTERNNNQVTIEHENIHKQVAIVAPYLEVIEEMTIKEFLHFHQTFKPFTSSVTINDIIQVIGLEKAADKQIRFYSSGMKQRVKLAQAIFADVSILLLDEPCTNLDTNGYKLYHQLIADYGKNKIIIVSSNDINEYSFCEEQINIMDYKTA